MNKKGFTLIELLAVIVILAIIALIAVPIVLNIINDAKESANQRSAELYEKAVQNAVLKKQMDGTTQVPGGQYIVMENGDICPLENLSGETCSSGKIEVEVEGERPAAGSTITLDANGKVIDYSLTISGEIKDKPTSGSGGEGTKTGPDYYFISNPNAEESVGDGLPSGVSKTKPSEKRIYLGFDAKDDKPGTTIDAAYVCFEKGGVTEPYCIKWSDDGSTFEDNKAILNTAFPGTCSSRDDDYYYCSGDGLDAETGSFDGVNVRCDSWYCYMSDNGWFGCYER